MGSSVLSVSFLQQLYKTLGRLLGSFGVPKSTDAEPMLSRSIPHTTQVSEERQSMSCACIRDSEVVETVDEINPYYSTTLSEVANVQQYSSVGYQSTRSTFHCHLIAKVQEELPECSRPAAFPPNL
ncbi:unnamed protein product [Notodromas monacha]|uniref:Uncharacterized protein n=1 Tax=Notodromas monacha TaxID=399045 RepID=A0A7R9C0N4_9CRUS|nr:unnamed protein product [Notodromas monacha]CAG0924140.1 unnamed protein product [Notodromas monacha]